MEAPYPALLKSVFQEAVSACSPEALLQRLVSTDNTGIRIAGHELGTGPIHVFASGKAAVSMTQAISRLLGNRIAGGIVVSPVSRPKLPPGFRHFTGGHPIPNRDSHRAGLAMMAALSALTPADPFVYLLSGGSSALLEVPIAPLSIGDIATVTAQLLNAGIPIENINRVRIHLSKLKGGGLGDLTRAKGLVLLMSDVLGNPLPVIGSGPFWPVERDYGSCISLLHQQNLWRQLPSAVRAVLTRPPADIPRKFRKFPHKIIGDNTRFLDAVQQALEKRKIFFDVADTALSGEAATVGDLVATFAQVTAATMKSGERFALLFSGEPTVRVRGSGLGGRCQELALAALGRLRGDPAVTVFAAGSDGRDGPTDAAGAIADSRAWHVAQEKGLSSAAFLKENDSYHFFEATDSLVKTGATGINLLDIVITLLHP